MDSDLISNGQEESTAPQEPSSKPTGSKRKVVSQSHFENLQSTMEDMCGEMATLLSLVKESVSPAKNTCLVDNSQSTNNPMLPVSNENQFLPHTTGNQFAIPSCVDQFPATRMPGSFDFGLAMPMAPNPASPMAQSHVSTDSAEGNFVPTFQNIEGEITNTTGQGLLADTAIHFVEDESLGPKILDVFAKYVEDCCCERILNAELLRLKDGFQRPESCPALSVPTINPNLWAQLPREQKEQDKQLQNAQSLLSKGLTGVVQVKEIILKFNTHPDKFFVLFKERNEKLDACVALLGKAFLESSYRHRDLLKTAIHLRFHSPCSTKTPITTNLFGDNILEAAKTISSSQKMTRSLAANWPTSSSASHSPFCSPYPPNRQQHSVAPLNY